MLRLPQFTNARQLRSIAAVVVALAAWPAAASGADAASPPILRAVGNGVSFVTPDAASLTISAARAGRSAGVARDIDNATLRAILAGLTATGLPAADVQTSAISLERQALGRSRKGKRQRYRYLASGTISVNTRRTDLLSRIFAAASRAGADSFDGPNYTLSDPSAGKLAAESAAIQDARRRADNAAAAAGMHVVGVQSIDLDPGSGTPLSGSATSSAPAKRTGSGGHGHAPIPTPTNAGKQEVDATVNVVFVISS